METAVYVHVPVCRQKCRYCAFYSEPLAEVSRWLDGYLSALEREIAMLNQRLGGMVTARTFFLGGGTPTALDTARLERLLGVLQRGLCFPAGAEKSVEVNPGTLTARKIELLRRFGVNRVSLGVQSFDDAVLRRIGRIHTAAQAAQGIALIRAAGFPQLDVNLDLMFGLPGQGMWEWRNSVEQALSYAPEHLSLYGLILEEGTPLGDAYARRRAGELWDLPDEDAQADMYDWASDRLRRAGYRRYETANFALPGRECRHHLVYWRGPDYLGLGPGAVTCLNGQRHKNGEDMRAYAAGALEREIEPLTREQRMTERVILGLRLAEGVNLVAFARDFGVELHDVYAAILPRYLDQGVLSVQDGSLRLTDAYAFVANTVLADFVIEEGE